MGFPRAGSNPAADVLLFKVLTNYLFKQSHHKSLLGLLGILGLFKRRTSLDTAIRLNWAHTERKLILSILLEAEIFALISLIGRSNVLFALAWIELVKDFHLFLRLRLRNRSSAVDAFPSLLSFSKHRCGNVGSSVGFRRLLFFLWW